jgi:hypothetical protein
MWPQYIFKHETPGLSYLLRKGIAQHVKMNNQLYLER